MWTGPVIRLSAVLLAIGALVALFLGPWTRAEPPVVQPVAFNHKAHVDTGMECGDCHTYFTTQTFSGLPSVDLCMGCHEDPITEAPEEQKIRDVAAAGQELMWNQLYHVPDHVYYSHRRHVVAGGLACATCHGMIAETEVPPSHALQSLSMDFCLACHEQRGASVDCIACHK